MLLGRRRLVDSHQQYARRLLVVRDQERAILAGEVHSEMAQRIAALRFELSGWTDPPPATAIATAATELEQLGDALRALAHRLHPQAIDHHGLGVALKQLQGDLQQKLHFDIFLQLRGDPMPKGGLANTLYRIVQEALNNIRAHTGEEEATVRVEVTATGVVVEIEDQGPGFDQTSDRGAGLAGIGLLSMRERAALAGGTLEIHSEIGTGTLIRVQIPTPSPVDVQAKG